MIVQAESAKESACYGTLSLAQSLLHSRLAWITSSFANISQTDSEKPRRLISTVEVQIGPHIYASTKFYYISDSTLDNSAAADALPPLAFEFGDNPGSLFSLPMDLGLEDLDSSGVVRAYFYASPTQPLRRLPSIINQEWPDYHVGERTLTRINLVIRNASAELTEHLTQYCNAHRTLVWRQYRTQTARLYPTVRRWHSFFPAEQLPKSLRNEPQTVTLKPPTSTRSPSKIQPKPTHTRSQQIQQAHSRPYTGGGKSGYNLAIAAAQKRYILECDSSSSDENMEDLTKPGEKENSQRNDLQKPSDLVPVRSYTPPPPLPPPPTPMPSSSQQGAPPVKTKRPYKRRTSTIQKTPSNPRRITLSPVGRSRKCSYCGCSETPIWRRGPGGTGTLCNACGVRWKLGKILQ
ncbi:hypothetical protein GGI09_004948 [Coemansia sp. S100]|nr:hypothetical protein LPJ71_003186 [Coemansia sp. S17]KAJ2095289.1 hypothetical protein GGI09_004948 [Coemansia sp. S100]KAJ2098836.1 hypothetical protein GGI16_004169 [Coemansia sp. S142-1]